MICYCINLLASCLTFTANLYCRFRLNCIILKHSVFNQCPLVGGGSFLHSLLSAISPGLLELGGYGVGSVVYWLECVSRDENEGFTKSVGTLSPEQDGGHTQPGCLGHERKAVLCGYRD